VENARCPGCGAAVRPQASWCSLCYLGLRVTSQLVGAAQDAPGSVGIAAPLVDAALEPAAGRRNDAGTGSGDNGDIAEADVVDDRRASAAQAAADPAPSAAAGHWPCTCGTEVAFDHDTCPVCGAAFLGDLRGDGGGRHRQDGGRAHLGWLPRSHRLRVGLAAFVAVLIAVLGPVLLALVG
jgi:hypothetical protein